MSASAENSGTPPSGEPEQPVALVMVAVATILLVASLGQTIVSTAIPIIVADLGGLDYLTWVITAYLLASTVGAPIYGKLGDLYGRKIVLQIAISIFLVGSVVCGLAFNMTVMVLGRALQGLGGGGLMVLALTVVADVLPARERGKFQGILAGVFGISTVVGPLIGGFLVEHLSWHWIFFVNLPVGLAALMVLGAALRPTDNRVKHDVDYAGAGLLATFLSSTVLVLSLGGRTFDWTALPALALIAVAVLSLVGFITVERRAAEPVMPLKLFTINNFVVSNAVGFIVGIAMFGAITFMPLYLQVVQGVTPTVSGLLLLPMMLGLFGTSTLSGRAMSRTGRYKWMPIASTLILSLGMGLLATLSPQTEIWQVMVFMFIAGMGIGPVMSIGVTVVQNAVPVETLGVATASVNMFRLIGGSIGTSVFGAIFSAGLAANLSGAMPGGMGGSPRAIGPDMVARLPPDVRDTVLTGFTDALHPVFWIASGLSLIAFGLSFLLREIELATTLPDREPVPEAEIDAAEEGFAAAAAPATNVRG